MRSYYDIVYGLRKQGMSLQDIGKCFECSTSWAAQMYRVALKNKPKEIEISKEYLLQDYSMLILYSIKDDIANIAYERTDKIKKIVYDYEKPVS